MQKKIVLAPFTLCVYSYIAVSYIVMQIMIYKSKIIDKILILPFVPLYIITPGNQPVVVTFPLETLGIFNELVKIW